jgi:hypothetical protein
LRAGEAIYWAMFHVKPPYSDAGARRILGRSLRLLFEYFAQRGKRAAQRVAGNNTHSSDQPHPVESAQLIEEDQPRSSLKSHRDAVGSSPTARRQRRDKSGAQIIVHLCGRYHEAGPRLLDFAADCGVERRQPYLATAYRRDPPHPRRHFTRSIRHRRCCRIPAKPGHRHQRRQSPATLQPSPHAVVF